MNDADRQYLEWERQKWVEEYYRGLGSQSGDGADGRPPRAGLGCVVMAVLVVGLCVVSWLPSAILVAACSLLGIPPLWGLRLVVLGATAAFGVFLYREWSLFRRLADAYGISTILEWRARRPGGPHRIPIWRFITAVGLTLSVFLSWSAPLNRAGGDLMGVFLVALIGGILLGGPIGIVVQIIDRNKQEKILIAKGPLPSIHSRPS